MTARHKKADPQVGFFAVEDGELHRRPAGYFLREYFSESSATAKIMMPPLMMYCQ